MYVDKQILSAEVMKLCVHIWCSEMTNLTTYVCSMSWVVRLHNYFQLVTFIIVNLDQKLSKSWCFKIPLKYRFYRSVSHFVKNSLINLLFAYYILNSTSISPVCSTKEIYKRAIIRVRLVIHFQTVFLSIV